MTKRTIGAVIFPDFEMLDYYGPLEIFSTHREAFEIRAVGETAKPVHASGGPATAPDDTFADDRYYDILLVPGGRGVRTEMHSDSFLSWLKIASDRAEVVTSVCTGSLLLAKAGQLDGRKATTNKNAFDWVVENAAFVAEYTPNTDPNNDPFSVAKD